MNGKKKTFLTILASALTASVLTLAGLWLLLGLDHYKISETMRLLGAMRFIEMNYVDQVDDTKLIDGAIDGMVKSLDDPHSLYLDQDMYKKLKIHTDGSFGGIGVVMAFDAQEVQVISVMDNTPGQQAGLQEGDKIIAIDGQPTKDMRPEEVAMNVRGDVGTQVVLRIHREGEEDKDYTITRDAIPEKTAAAQMLPEGMGYIRIASFSEKTGQEFKDCLADMEGQGMKGLILDLRENPGGLITSCVEIANLVVPKGEIVSVVDRDGNREEHDSTLEESKYPIVVLIDENSASAAEILAGALQDRQAATLVGTKSYGKGSVQLIMPMFEGDAMKLTVAKYYTPSGRSIDGTGIEPDVAVAGDPNSHIDQQLIKAIEVMREKLK